MKHQSLKKLTKREVLERSHAELATARCAEEESRFDLARKLMEVRGEGAWGSPGGRGMKWGFDGLQGTESGGLSARDWWVCRAVCYHVTRPPNTHKPSCNASLATSIPASSTLHLPIHPQPSTPILTHLQLTFTTLYPPLPRAPSPPTLPLPERLG